MNEDKFNTLMDRIANLIVDEIQTDNIERSFYETYKLAKNVRKHLLNEINELKVHPKYVEYEKALDKQKKAKKLKRDIKAIIKE